MAYQIADGFDNYGNSYTLVAGYPWSGFSPGGAQTVITSDYRFAPPSGIPGGCLVCASGGQNWIRYNLSSNQTTLIMGFGFKAISLPSGTNDICGFWDSGNPQVSLALTSTGALQFYRASGSTTLSTAIGPATAGSTIAAGVWYGIQIQITINSTSGAVACYINGASTPAITASSINTQSTANAYAGQVSIGSNAGSTQPTFHFDDFFCFDNTGAFLNSLLGGDARIITKMPASAGTYTNWTPNGMTFNYQNAAVQPPSTSDYNANNVGGTSDSYTMASAGLGVAPYFVVARASLERDDAGPHTPTVFVRSGSTNSTGTVTPALTSGYLWYDAVVQNDPNTGVAWSSVGADAAQVGITEG
jgi:hypothetical protein